MEKPDEEKTEIQKLRFKQADFQLRFPELFLSDTSIYPSYTNLKLPYQVICRERKNAYKAMQTLQFKMEVNDLALRQARAWDGVRVTRIFDYKPKAKIVANNVPDPLTSKERQRLYKIMSS